jgi:2-keto-3-deoxy-L-rhamnonate aldolase RhmA
MNVSTDQFRLLFITNEPELAQFAYHSGVDRIFVDLETLGKDERQGHLNTVISRHTIEDVRKIRETVPRGSLLVRLNPLNFNSSTEVEDVLRSGADTLMLPMFRGAPEVQKFCSLVAGRAKVCLLVETVGAVRNLEECISVAGVSEVHIGLNDLHLDLRMSFMFEPLADGLIDHAAAVLRDSGMQFGIGGLARIGEGLLPPEMILGEHVRLGSTGAILSRTFHRQAKSVEEIRAQMDFAAEVRKLREAHADFLSSSAEALRSNREEVVRLIRDIAGGLPPR